MLYTTAHIKIFQLAASLSTRCQLVVFFCTGEKCVDQLTEIEETMSALLRDLVYTASHINKASTITSCLADIPPPCGPSLPINNTVVPRQKPVCY